MTMEHRRSRKRRSRRRPGTAAMMGCCCLAASTVSASAAADVPHSVRPDNSPQHRLESRREEHENYRRLARRRAESTGEADGGSAIKSINDEGRRLPGDNAGIHKKGQEYAPVGVHQKGNKVSSAEVVEEEPMQFTALGGSSNNDDPPPDSSQADDHNDSGGGDDDDDGMDQRLATNLRSFTRIGGRGYALPPEKRHPYMCSLQLEGHSPSGEEFDVHMCGGFLVAPEIVMTSAHCAEYSPQGTDETYQAFNGVEIGKVDLSDEGAAFDPYSSETYRLYYENLVPDKLIKHPDYDEVTYEHDVMLVKVFGKSRFPPVKLARDDIGYANVDEVTVLGWGADRADSNPRYSNRLKSARLDLMSNGQCKNTDVRVRDPVTKQTSRMSLRDHVFDDMMCAKSRDRHICYGDAGGPAIRPGANSDEDEVYGIVSWGYGCVDSNYPAVLTRMSDNWNFVKTTVCDLSSDPPDWFGCSPKMTALSSGSMETVTLKLKLDAMAVETGFVVEVADSGEIVAQRQTGYYRKEGNEVIEETMELPGNACYNLVLLDAYGDGMCCHNGGGNGIVYKGTDTGYYTGEKLVEVSGNFEFDNRGEFCLGRGSSSGNSMESQSNVPPPTRPPTRPPRRSPQSAPTPPTRPVVDTSSNFISDSILGDASSWSGPSDSPEYAYCTNFCNSVTSPGKTCGKFACNFVQDVATSDVEEEEDVETPSPTVTPGPLLSEEFFEEGSEYYLTVQIQFDDNPHEVSWVLYDLTTNEVQVFVDFGAYPQEDYANQLMNIRVTMDGPKEGEKEYAFTVYDKASNGLCCQHGDGYYKVFLGDPEYELELLGDDEFDFSSSFYFTLFEDGEDDEVFEEEEEEEDDDDTTRRPTRRPTKRPSRQPTRRPTGRPTALPTKRPSPNPTPLPTTERPTNPWEMKRAEDAADIGARWSVRMNTEPGVFNDVGGDQEHYGFNTVGIRSAAPRDSSRAGFVAGLTLCCMLALAMMN